jgi:hypothetical protein
LRMRTIGKGGEDQHGGEPDDRRAHALAGLRAQASGLRAD